MVAFVGKVSLLLVGQIGPPDGSVNRFDKFWSDWAARWICKQI